MKPERTTAAVAARRQQTERKLQQVTAAIAQLKRESGRPTVRAIAARAGVSATFLYENEQARQLIRDGLADVERRQDRAVQRTHDQVEATWRERALNAEEQLKRTQAEIFAQRRQIGELLGQQRDADLMVPGDSVQALRSENTSLKRRVQQLSTEHRTLQERLEGARSNLRFAEKRIAALEAQIVEIQLSGADNDGLPET
jgi:chromosome segregation ATPase